MGFLALVLALALEQWRPLVDRRAVFAPVVGYAGYLERQFNAGEANQGAVAWLLAVAPLAVAAWAVYALLDALNPIAGLLFNVAVLYVTMGFREHSHYFTRVHKALKEGDLVDAPRLLGEWRGHPCETLSASEIARLAIEGAFTVSHRHVFAVMFWFLLLPGPSGAVLYRTALFLSRRWGRMARAGEPGPMFDLAGVDAEAGPVRADYEPPGRFGEFARRAFHALNGCRRGSPPPRSRISGRLRPRSTAGGRRPRAGPIRCSGWCSPPGPARSACGLGRRSRADPVVEDRPGLGLGRKRTRRSSTPLWG